MTNLQIHKYQALGNDMLVIDPAKFTNELTPELVQRICQRHFGVGADGICYGPLPGIIPNLTMRFFNPDGSEAEKSGNGLRIFARYLWDAGYVPQEKGQPFTMYINNEAIETTVEDEEASTITTVLGRLSFSRPFTANSLNELLGSTLPTEERIFGATAIDIGNPHFVLFVDALSAELVKEVGPLLETAVPFPNRTNVQLVKVIDMHTIRIEIWERGAGYTLASGTSASAAAGAAIWNGRCQSPIKVHMPGGTAKVAVDDQWRVALTGSVAHVFSGSLAEKFL